MRWPDSNGRRRLRKISAGGLQPKLSLKLFRRAGNHRPKENAQGAANFGQRVKYIVQIAGARRVFGDFERAGLVDVLIGARDQRARPLQALPASELAR